MKQNLSICSRLASSLGTAFNEGKLRIYSGVMPDLDDVISNTMLCEINLPNPAFLSPVDGVISKTGVWQGLVVANGVATWAKIMNSLNTQFIFVTVGEGAEELVLSESTLAISDIVTIDTSTITIPTE